MRTARVWAVGERECSIQRRHQKVIEEAPSPLVQRVPGMRDRLFEAARLAATAIGYTGAGTVEFMASGADTERGEFFFLEMNTRLQVENPVTEETTGLDLVQLQIEVATAPAAAHPPESHGHAIEARLYAEDPATTGNPGRCPAPVRCAGHPNRVRHPGPSGCARRSPGVADGSVVSVFYDPMLAKVIAFAPTGSAPQRS
jgi:acetyl/propionyl-CoA carboxylase alpha subunit